MHGCVRVQRSLVGMVMILTCSVLTSPAQAQDCGDADGNGQVTVTDGVNVLRAAAGLSSACTARASLCDVDGNATVTVTDGVNVLRSAAGLSASLDCRSDECRDSTGAVHKFGEPWTDGCNNSCSCDQQGRAACTALACACPRNGTVNCMPPVPSANAALCLGAYHTWVVANCPGVNFVY